MSLKTFALIGLAQALIATILFGAALATETVNQSLSQSLYGIQYIIRLTYAINMVIIAIKCFKAKFPWIGAGSIFIALLQLCEHKITLYYSAVEVITPELVTIMALLISLFLLLTFAFFISPLIALLNKDDHLIS